AASVSPDASAAAINAGMKRGSEVIDHAQADEGVLALVDLLQIDEVVEPVGQAVTARDDGEVVRRRVRAGEACLVEDDAAPVVERAQAGAVLDVEPVERVVGKLQVVGEVVVVEADTADAGAAARNVGAEKARSQAEVLEHG